MTPDMARSLVLTTTSLERDGIPVSRVRKMVADHELVVVHRGRYVRRAEWDAVFPESRHLFAVVAADSFRMSDDVVFAFASAAVAHGLPLFRHVASAPHICTPDADGVVGRDRALRRHEIEVAESDRVLIDGIPVTSLERTVYDIIRTTSRETAAACADAALRYAAWDPERRTYDVEASESWRAALKERIARGSGAKSLGSHLAKFGITPVT